MSMTIQLKGRIDHTEFFNGKNMTIITTPAVDAYSQPASYKLRSQAQLGAVGQEIMVDVSISGFVRKKPYTDKQTQQPKIYWEDNVFLDATPAQAAPQAVSPRAAKAS